MAVDQFSLCWNNFHSNLSSGFHSLYESEDLVDVTLAVEGRYLKAHKMVLSVCSQYFKQLFQVNPCKHPIVILKDVSYNSLKDLLQFMYLGEVSVSQLELGNLMKVAELLQIKGLTEDNDSSSHINRNGLKDTHVSESRNETRPYLKRSKNVKRTRTEIPSKIAKQDSPSESRESLTPTKIDIETDPSVLEPELVVKPKDEPLYDPSESGEYSEHSLPEMDVSSMLDTSLGGGETSSQSSSACWTKSDQPVLSVINQRPIETSTGSGLRFVTTPKGRTVVIHNGHMYTLSHQKDTKTTWVCVMQRKLNCAGCVTTSSHGGPILLSYSGHNHAQLNDVIQRLDCTHVASVTVPMPPILPLPHITGSSASGSPSTVVTPAAAVAPATATVTATAGASASPSPSSSTLTQ